MQYVQNHHLFTYGHHNQQPSSFYRQVYGPYKVIRAVYIGLNFLPNRKLNIRELFYDLYMGHITLYDPHTIN
ncbi:hypothetical protein HanRHA438_Chr15g0713271 [Helianthus annuus]|nr:hypothetical protein HanRHA438_Chr15g0713271 [Helianthus annuus]